MKTAPTGASATPENPPETRQPPTVTGTALDIKEIRHALLFAWINATVAIQVRELRKQRGWSQQELADLASVDVGTINRIEHLRWSLAPNMGTLIRIAAAFDCAFIGRFCTWSEVLHNFADFNFGSCTPEPFEIEDAMCSLGSDESTTPPAPAASEGDQ